MSFVVRPCVTRICPADRFGPAFNLLNLLRQEGLVAKNPRSAISLSKANLVERGTYLFVIEDIKKVVVGSSLVMAKHGSLRKFPITIFAC